MREVNGVSLSARRAWIEIAAIRLAVLSYYQSLSARRAWIEIGMSVASNFKHPSLSARRAWIEMLFRQRKTGSVKSSLSARRAWIEIIDDLEPSTTRRCRSPQGERG